jgi:hypothetical protein
VRVLRLPDRKLLETLAGLEGFPETIILLLDGAEHPFEVLVFLSDPGKKKIILPHLFEPKKGLLSPVLEGEGNLQQNFLDEGGFPPFLGVNGHKDQRQEKEEQGGE